MGALDWCQSQRSGMTLKGHYAHWFLFPTCTIILYLFIIIKEVQKNKQLISDKQHITNDSKNAVVYFMDIYSEFWVSEINTNKLTKQT